MKFYTKSHLFYCGIDLHARSLYVCILDKEGKTVLHKEIKAHPDPLLDLISPYMDDLVIGRVDFLQPIPKPVRLISHLIGVRKFLPLIKDTYTLSEPETNWRIAARPLNSAGMRLADECLVPLINHMDLPDQADGQRHHKRASICVCCK